MSNSGQEESKQMSQSTNALQSRLFPTNASSGDIRMKSSASSGTLKPRGMNLLASKSAAQLPIARSTTSKVAIDLNERTLSTSVSARVLNNKVTKNFTSMDSLVQRLDGDEYSMDLPPVPDSEMKTNDGEYGGFLNELNLTGDERHALQHVPNTFFYMRIKNSANIPVPVGKTRKQQKVEGTSNGNGGASTELLLDNVNAASALSLSVDTIGGNSNNNNKSSEEQAAAATMNASVALSQLSVGDIPPTPATANGGNELLDEFGQSMTSSQFLQCTLSLHEERKVIETERCSVYDLEVVPQEYIDKDHYFTLSKEGVTIYKDRQSQFTMLTQWEREASLFNQISNIYFFTV